MLQAGFLCFLALLPLCLAASNNSASHHHKWSYEGDTGPLHWQNLSSGALCAGKKQSPIDIVTADVVADPNLPEFNFENYEDATMKGRWSIQNNGHSVMVIMDHTNYKLSGGGLNDTYILHHFHLHWGSTSEQGSEHTVNGKKYPMEIHFVHYNSKYGNLTNAIDKTPDGLAVLGFFFEVDNSASLQYSKSGFLTLLPSVGKSGASNVLPALHLKSVMANNVKSFYRYMGSLTTPGCFESVVWTVFEDTIKITEQELNVFRDSLKFEGINEAEGDPMVDNYRPVVPLNGRVVSKRVWNPPQTTTQSNKGNPSGSNVITYSFSMLAMCVIAVLLHLH